MDFSRLNEKQLEAVKQTEGPVLILAGAGSGKTQTMTHRIAYMVESGINPYHILAVTFTNKAATEMRDRVERFGFDVRGMWIMTFHAMSLRMLRENVECTGYEKNFVVYDTTDTKSIVKNILKEKNIDTKEYPVNYFQSIISKEKEADRDPDSFLEKEGYTLKTKMIYEVYQEYQKTLVKNNAMDFDDLLVNAYHLLKDNKEVREYYQQRFQYVMVDEYQDTNHLQYELIHIISKKHNNLCVVGDDDQCIYQWRGADISNILDFEKDYPSTKVIKLEQNYRSFGNILALANSVIKHNAQRKQKALWTSKEPGDKITYFRTGSDKDEADRIGREISDLRRKDDRSYDDFAVLYRNNSQARLIEDALKRRSIPYQVLSGFSFYDRKETKDMISYLRLVVNPKDDVALERVINEPKRGIGPTTMLKLKNVAKAYNISLYDALSQDQVEVKLPSKAQQEVSNMVNLINLLREEEENLRIEDIYDDLLKKTGYLQALEAEHTVEADARIENLMDFKSFIYDYEEEKKKQGENPTLAEFLERVSLNSDQDKYDDESGKVTLMTLHSSKGLEFPVVFIPGLEEGLFPSRQSAMEPGKIEEERRLCYVGMTRAMQKLFLLSAEYRVLYGQGEYTRESRFMTELDASLLDDRGDSAYQGKTRNDTGLRMDTGSYDGYRGESRNPFAYDPLKYAKKETKSIGSNDDFIPGDQVTHAKFGHGTVIESDAKTVTIMFDEAGQKKLAKGIAPIKKV